MEAVLPDPNSGDEFLGPVFVHFAIPLWLGRTRERSGVFVMCALVQTCCGGSEILPSGAAAPSRKLRGGFHAPRFTAIGSTKHVRKQARHDGSAGQNRDSSANKAFSSGEAATITRIAPASRSTVATPAEMQSCGTDSADISRPAVRTASRKACALRLE